MERVELWNQWCELDSLPERCKRTDLKVASDWVLTAGEADGISEPANVTRHAGCPNDAPAVASGVFERPARRVDKQFVAYRKAAHLRPTCAWKRHPTGRQDPAERLTVADNQEIRDHSEIVSIRASRCEPTTQSITGLTLRPDTTASRRGRVVEVCGGWSTSWPSAAWCRCPGNRGRLGPSPIRRQPTRPARLTKCRTDLKGDLRIRPYIANTPNAFKCCAARPLLAAPKVRSCRRAVR